VLALEGTPAPGFVDLRNWVLGKKPLPEIYMKAGQLDLYSGANYASSLTLSGLYGNTRYSVFGWPENLDGLPAERVREEKFKTTERHLAARFLMGFNTVYISDDDLDNI
jgi:hypothetical protein